MAVMPRRPASRASTDSTSATAPISMNASAASPLAAAMSALTLRSTAARPQRPHSRGDLRAAPRACAFVGAEVNDRRAYVGAVPVVDGEGDFDEAEDPVVGDDEAVVVGEVRAGREAEVVDIGVACGADGPRHCCAPLPAAD